MYKRQKLEHVTSSLAIHRSSENITCNTHALHYENSIFHFSLAFYYVMKEKLYIFYIEFKIKFWGIQQFKQKHNTKFTCFLWTWFLGKYERVNRSQKVSFLPPSYPCHHKNYLKNFWSITKTGGRVPIMNYWICTRIWTWFIQLKWADSAGLIMCQGCHKRRFQERF